MSDPTPSDKLLEEILWDLITEAISLGMKPDPITLRADKEKLSDSATQSLLALIKTSERKARIDEIEMALEAGHGKTWDAQMAGTCGHVGKRYKELKGGNDV